jgi:hypothetical protein
LSEAIAMESASRVMTRKALDMLKTFATGEYKPAETETAPVEVVVEEEKLEAEKNSEEAEAAPELSESAPRSNEEEKAE